MSIDLHLHTYYSDGNWSPEELVEQAVRCKLKYIAITDHDTTGGIARARAAAAGRLEVVNGIEFNTVWYAPDGQKHDVHILGYFIDTDNPVLKSAIQQQQDARQQLVHDIVSKLSERGVELNASHIAAVAGHGSIGRPHITRAIVACGGAGSVEEAYEIFMTRTSPHYIPRDSISPATAIAGIMAAGGIASLAHPGKNGFGADCVDLLIKQGLGAIEAYHRSHSLKQLRQYLRLASSRGLLVTGGSDCHGPFGDYAPSIGTVRVPLDVVHTLRAHAGR
jgi:3',5'-nucleoside bisphosphate phosphatase